MPRWRLILICLTSLQVAYPGVPAAADGGPPAGPHWPGGLPGDWRSLGGDDADLGDRLSTRPDFGLAPLTRQAPAAAPDFGPNGAAKPADPEKDAAAAKAAWAKARGEELKKAMAPRPEPAVLRQRALDDLFKHLAAAADPEEAKGVAEAIRRVWLQTPSDTASLLMQRALAATEARNYQTALTLLDRLVALEPNWAEAWNQRAAVRFLIDDADGSMADIDRAIKLEPRHFAALTGMGVILQHAGLGRRALEVFGKALEIYPAQPGLRETVEKLGLEVNGRDI